MIIRSIKKCIGVEDIIYDTFKINLQNLHFLKEVMWIKFCYVKVILSNGRSVFIQKSDDVS